MASILLPQSAAGASGGVTSKTRFAAAERETQARPRAGTAVPLSRRDPFLRGVPTPWEPHGECRAGPVLSPLRTAQAGHRGGASRAQ